jgi:photosystem II stability/assembly factor-like uncharacterized protein
MHYFYSLLIVVISFLMFVRCSSDPASNEPVSFGGTFGEPSLVQQQVFQLEVNGENLYAGTSNNLHRKSVLQPEWVSLGLPGGEVRTFVVLSNQKLLAAPDIDNRDSLTIARTTDGGQNWVPFRNGFGGGITRGIPSTLASDQSDSGILLGGGPGAPTIAQSVDQGQSWQLISGTWGNLGFLEFIKIENGNSLRIWAGGSNAVFAPLLIRSTDRGDTWQNLQVIENVETTVYDLVANKSNSNVLLAGTSGAVTPANLIRKSTDGGQTWETVRENIGALTLTHSARNPEVVYASGRNANGTLFFAASNDFGDTWETVEMENSSSGMRVNDMVSVIENGKEVLYLGTNQGVYSYRFEE